MKYIRFQKDGAARYGVIDGGALHEIVGTPFGRWEKSGGALDAASVRLLAPTLPTKIVCLGLNYADHAAEMKHQTPEEPVIFLKPSTAVIGPGEPIVYPPQSKRVDYEAELAIVIKKAAKNIPAASWRDYVLGYTCFNDVTARDLQTKDGQWTRAKGFDTFAPVGPWITDEVSPDDLAIEARVNGVVKQKSRTARLIFKPAFLIPFLSRVMTLLPGDIIATGTPSGISGMNVGDLVEVEIEGIGTLGNRVVAPEGA